MVGPVLVVERVADGVKDLVDDGDSVIARGNCPANAATAASAAVCTSSIEGCRRRIGGR